MANFPSAEPRFQIGEAVIKESRSLRLIHSVQLNQQTETPTAQQPFLVIGNGRTYTVSDTLPKKAIMDVLQRSAIVKKSKSNGKYNILQYYFQFTFSILLLYGSII